MKLLAIILMAFSLSGCFYQTTNQYDLQDAIKICGTLENIASISSDFSSEESVTCMNNMSSRLHKK